MAVVAFTVQPVVPASVTAYVIVVPPEAVANELGVIEPELNATEGVGDQVTV
jgi:hypothetical protein